MSDDLVERVAQRICNTAGSNWNAENFNQTDDGSYPEDQREYYRMLASAAIAVALEEAAKVVDSMAEDLAREFEPSPSIAWVREKAAAIRAMIPQEDK